MDIKQEILNQIKQLISDLYHLKDIPLQVHQNQSDFEGDFTVVIFPLVKYLKKKPELIGEEIGNRLIKEVDFISKYTVIKGFLNLELSIDIFHRIFTETQNNFGKIFPKNKTIMVEYASPNTNKPLHLGHIRNILLGYSISQIVEEAGYNVIKTQIINDRGIHICKSMLAWKKFGNEETPDSKQIKGDKFVGNYYVKFEQEYKKQIKELKIQGISEEEAKKIAPIFVEAQKMLKKWEEGDEKVHDLWKKMNTWVYKGFDQTYHNLEVNFDQTQYESQTYLLGKDMIEKGLGKKVLYKKEDGSVWCDLTENGLDEKLLLRKDKTAVYMTQDLGTAVERFENNDIHKLIYTVGNEQDYHFQSLFLILKKLGYTWANQLYHLSYGMVELPEGKMKSREGTTVDADDLIQEMYCTAKEKTQELGKLENLSDEEKEESYKSIGLGALKYFILKIDPKKKILFNPKESIDFNGNTGPFIQYTYARINSLLEKAGTKNQANNPHLEINSFEKELILALADFKNTIEKSAEMLSPALLANYIYELVKSYNSFYQNNSVLNCESLERKNFRLFLSELTAKTIKKGLKLLGIKTVKQM